MSDIKNTPSPRREFLQNSLWLLAAFPLLAHVLTGCDSKSGNSAVPAGKQAAKEDEAVAASLGYKEDASKVDTAKFPKRAGPEGSKQFCHNCQFYTAEGDSGWGNCQIIRSGLVKADGWCNTWAAKPGTT
jgi:hypothetical protein